MDHSWRRRIFPHILLRWPVLRLHVLLGAAAAALDARCLHTLANTGDCAARHDCNPGVDQWCGTNAPLMLSLDPQSDAIPKENSTEAKIVPFHAREPWYAPLYVFDTNTAQIIVMTCDHTGKNSAILQAKHSRYRGDLKRPVFAV